MGSAELGCVDAAAAWGFVEDGLDNFGYWAHDLGLGDNTY
jgi:hypothetical protein